MEINTEMQNIKSFGYIRTSSKDQNLARQQVEMEKLGIHTRDIYTDQQSGKDFDRPSYQALKRTLRAGDTLYIKSIDRFGRNSKEILKEWDYITQEVKADIVVLDMPLLDTRQYKDTLGDFVSRLVLQVLAFVAQKEREDIKIRQEEGIKLALAKGVKFGKPKLKVPSEFEGVYKQVKAGEIKAVEAMQNLGLKKTSYYKLVKQYEELKKKR